MRIKVIGDCDSARALRGLLRKAGFAVTEFLPAQLVTELPSGGYVIYIEESAINLADAEAGKNILFDSVDSELEANILRHVTQLTPHPVVVDRPGGAVHSDREIRIVVPKSLAAGDGHGREATAVEFGVLRGLMDTVGGKVVPTLPKPVRWWKRVFGILVLAMLGGSACAAPPAPRLTPEQQRTRFLLWPLLPQTQSVLSPVQVNVATIAGTTPSFTGSSLNINCTGGCGGAATFADSSAFTAGTTGITNIGGVFNDGLAAVTSGNAAAPRITAQRGVHINLRDNSGNELASATAQPAGTERGLIVREAQKGQATMANSQPVVIASDQSAFSVTANQGSPPWQVVGNVASGGADSGNPVKGGGVFNATQPTVTTGQRVDQQMTARGAAIIASGVDAIAVNNTQQGTAAQNLTQWATTALGTPTAFGTTPGAVVAGSVNASIMSGTTALGTPNTFGTTAPTGNALGANVSLFQGTTLTPSGTGASGAGVPRVTVANDSSILGTKTNNNAAPGATNFGTLPALANAANPSWTEGNQVALSVDLTGYNRTNLGRWNGTALGTPTNFGTSPGAVIAGSVNSSLFIGTTVATAASAGIQKVGISGNAGASVDSANNAAVPANILYQGDETITVSGSNPASATSGNGRRVVSDIQGNQFFRPGGPNIFTCRVLAITAITQCQAAPGAGLRAYVTDITFINNTAGAQTIKLQFGTGTNCGTGTTDLTAAVQFAAAVGNYDHSYQVPPVPTAANAICVTPSAATSISATLTGYIAP